MWKRFEKIFGIDLGTSNTVVAERGKGIVLNEPTVVAVDQVKGKIIAAGSEAQAMIGRSPAHIELISPLINGVIANFDLTGKMLEHFMKTVQARDSLLRRSQVYISVPCGISNVQKRAVEDTVIYKSAGKVVTVEEPLAAAIGAGLPIHEPVGHVVLDLGGGTSQAAILSLGGIVTSRTSHRAGSSLDRDIRDYIRRRHGLEIGERTAERIKTEIGAALMPSKEQALEVRGRDVVDGLPRSVNVYASEIFGLVDEYIDSVLQMIRETMEQCPPELAADVVEQGIFLCGGGALLQGIDERIRVETKVPVHRSERPTECAAVGICKLM